MVAVTKPPPQP